MRYSPKEMMTCAAARALSNDDICFVGIGAPSLACNLARLNHAPNLTLIYESGTLGARPSAPPLSIGDGELCDTATTTVSVPEMFRYWLQGGRISIGFLGGAQIDRYGNINTTVIGEYSDPEVRLPGAGGAPEIATSCHQVFVVMTHSRRKMVEELSFCTSLGHGRGPADRDAFGLSTQGPSLLVTDLCIMRSDPQTKEFIVTSLHPGVSKQDVIDNTGWCVKFSDPCNETLPPDENMLTILRAFEAGEYKEERRGA